MKIFGGSGENETRKKRGEEMEGDGSYIRAENCETAVNKVHHDVGSYPLRCCGNFANTFPPRI